MHIQERNAHIEECMWHAWPFVRGILSHMILKLCSKENRLGYLNCIKKQGSS